MNSHDAKVINSVLAVLDFAESLPIEMIPVRNSQPVYPVTFGEKLVNYTLGLLIRHKWSSDETEELISEIESSLSQLDTGVDNEEEWRFLFEAKNRLSSQINDI